MCIAMRLYIKDLFHRWPYIAILWLLVVLRAVIDVMLPQHPRLFSLHTSSFSLLTYLLCFLITALVVQADPLVGDQQFWITRPISRRNLLAGKFLFLICSIHAPVLIAQTAAIIGNGLSLLHYLPVLAEEQLMLAAILATAAVFASVTRNLAQLTIMLLASAGAGILLQAYSSRLYAADWRSAQNLRSSILYLLVALIASLLLWLHYSRRTTRLAIVIVFILIIAGSSSYEKASLANLGHAAARYRARQDGTLRSQSPVTVTFRYASPAQYYSRGLIVVEKNMAGFTLPVRVTGMPEGHGLINEGMKFAVIAPDGSAWESGWTDFGKLRGLQVYPGHGLVPADGDFNITVNMNWGFYQRIQNKNVRVRALLAFRLVGPPVPAILQQDRLSPILNGNGLCKPSLDKYSTQPDCTFSKLPSAVLFYQGQNISLSDSGSGTSIWRYTTEKIYSYPLPQPSEDKISVRQEEAWFETTMDIPQIRLSDYFYTRFGK
jgi:hypothetical protein